MNNKTALSWTWISLLIIILDQLTKYAITHHLTEPKTLLPFLNLTLRFNPGAAFSFLGNASGWQIYLFSLISIVVSILLLTWLKSLNKNDWTTAIPLTFILGGAIGNLIDRIHYGYVIDFIDFHINHWHFATFNIADSFVSIGATLLIVKLLYEVITRQP